MNVDWRGFELHPETPPGGMELSELFGSRVEAMRRQLREFATSLGITDMRHNMHMPNTRRALAICEHARGEGKLDGFREITMNAYWREGRDIEDPAVLEELAVKAGLDGKAALQAMDDPRMLAQVDALQSEARQMGVRGIPTFIIGRYAVVGCQPVEVLESALKQAGLATPKK